LPFYAFFLGLFTFASLGLPGMSGFVGEFLAVLGAWQYHKWIGFTAFVVVILAGWYMLWMYQQVIQGRAHGEMPDPRDGELTEDEKAMLAGSGSAHDDHGHAPAFAPVSGGSQDHGHDDDHDPLDSSRWPDLNRRELITLVPLAVLTIVFGIYPNPIFDIVGPSFERIMDPFMRGPLGG
jgi:NADH-quinone oxidoreductase subunit M